MRIVVMGAGQNGGQVYNILKHNKELEVVCFLDDDPAKQGTKRYNLPVLGPISEFRAIADDLRLEGGIAAVGDNFTRARLTDHLLGAGLRVVSAVHPFTCVDDTAKVGAGVIL